MHKLLQRQLKKAGQTAGEGSLDIPGFVALVEAAYEEFDRQRRVLAHTHEVMRDEYGKLNARLSRLRDAISQMGAGFAIWDGDDCMVICNERLREILRDSADLLRPGVPFVDLVRSAAPFIAGAGPAEAWMATRIARHRNPSAPFEAAFKDGRHIQVWEEKTGEGGIVSLYLDVTERKRAEDELRRAKEMAETASHSKSQFLANVSHELRTPLNAIIGFSEVMLAELLGPLGNRRYREYAGDIHGAGTHLLDIINDLLDMSKIEAGQHDLDAQWLEIGGLIQAALRFIRERAREAGVAVGVAVAPNLPAVFAEPRALKQVLLNLLGNAVKFTPQGGRIEIEASLSPDGGLMLCVSDTGVGIAAHDIPQVLMPFGQVERALSRAHGGVGLGLPLSKRLVELHGGSLAIASEPGSGTTITVALPPERVGRPELKSA